MKTIVFHYAKELEKFPDIIEYIREIKKESNYEVCYIGFSNTLEGSYRNEELNIKVYYIDRRESLKDRLKSLRSRICKIDPNIVHVFHYRGSGLVPIMQRKHKAKCILDVRTLTVENKKGKPNRGLILYLKDKLTWLESLTYYKSLALTPTIKNRITPSKRDVPIIPLGANQELFRTCADPVRKKEVRKELHIEPGEIVILYSGVLSPSRKMEIPLESICRLAVRLGGKTALIVGGSSFQSYFEALKEIPHRYGVSDKIRFYGRVPYQEVSKYYAASDIGISFTPSDTAYANQPPTKVIEYLMSGMLVVSNRTTAIEKLVIENETGFLSNDTVQGFANALQAAFEHLKTQEHYSEKSIQSVLDLSWNNIVKNKLLPIYEKII